VCTFLEVMPEASLQLQVSCASSVLSVFVFPVPHHVTRVAVAVCPWVAVASCKLSDMPDKRWVCEGDSDLSTPPKRHTQAKQG
jgi:hypothetical protein